jgi:anti-sigma regulatory factor (Ser/Thr protein kinase)
MTTVSIAIARDPALVRTVRLVAAAVARRAALDEAVIEEVRLAVGEACAVMIGLDAHDGGAATKVEGGAHEHPGDQQVRVQLSVDRGIGAVVEGRMADVPLEVDGLGLTPWALLMGLSEDVTVEESGQTARVRMSWPGL